ncbi:MAG: sigma-70 family RNA polymerase sigma factor [Planctomycetota bacterium]|nr:sigma-70 family RNA polymerase sigma factor [Planctomycetota bacterium]
MRHNSDDGDGRGGLPQPVAGDRLSRDRFSALFAEHHKTLWFIAASVHGDRTHAYDVVQEAAMVALNKIAEFDPSTSFAAWMGQIVRYVALNEGRKLKRTRAAGASDVMTSDPIPFTAAHQAQVVPLVGATESIDSDVAQAIAMLDEKARTCLLLRTVQGLSYAAISTALSMPEGTVMSHVHRAKALLREEITRRESNRSSGRKGAAV